MYELCLAFGDSETICVSPMSNFPNGLLQLTLGSLHIFWSWSDGEVVNIKVILNSCCNAVYLILNSITDRILLWGTPSSFLWWLEKVDPTQTWNFLCERNLYEGQSALQPHAMQVFHYSKLPGGLISLLQIKKDCYKVFLDVGLSYGGFQFDHLIDCRSLLSESTLRIGDKFVGLEKPDQSFVGHMLHSFAEAAS